MHDSLHVRRAGELLSERQFGVTYAAASAPSKLAVAAPAANGAMAARPPARAAAVPSEHRTRSAAPRDADAHAHASSGSGGTSQDAPATPDADADLHWQPPGMKRARRESSSPPPQPEAKQGSRCANMPPDADCPLGWRDHFSKHAGLCGCERYQGDSPPCGPSAHVWSRRAWRSSRLGTRTFDDS